MVRRANRKPKGRPTREQRKIILIAAEGINKTEQTYFSEFNRMQDRRSQEQDIKRQIALLKEEKEMLITQLVEMDRVIQENQHLKKLLASRMRE